MTGENFSYILERVGDAGVLEQLAEEAAELAQAALKLARIRRGENPTPVTFEEAIANLEEEYTDVVHVAMVYGLSPDFGMLIEKDDRWLNRLKMAKN